MIQQISVLINGVNLLIPLSLSYLHWRYATIDHRLVDSTVSFVNIDASRVLNITTPLYYLILVRKYKTWFWLNKKDSIHSIL